MSRKVVIVGGRPDMAAAAIAAINAGGNVVAVHADERPGWIDIPIADIMAGARQNEEVVFAYDPGDIDPLGLRELAWSGSVTAQFEDPEAFRRILKPSLPNTALPLTRQQRRYRARKGIR